MLTGIIIISIIALVISIFVIYRDDLKRIIKKHEKTSFKQIIKEEAPLKKEEVVEEFVSKKDYGYNDDRDESLSKLLEDNFSEDNFVSDSSTQELETKSINIKQEKTIKEEIDGLSPKLKILLIDGLLKKED